MTAERSIAESSHLSLIKKMTVRNGGPKRAVRLVEWDAVIGWDFTIPVLTRSAHLTERAGSVEPLSMAYKRCSIASMPWHV